MLAASTKTSTRTITFLMDRCQGFHQLVPLSGENGFFFTANRSRCWHGEDVVLGSNNHEEDCLANLYLGSGFVSGYREASLPSPRARCKLAFTH
jgi:hypothetical protein